MEKRRKIYKYILENPGVHFSELSKKLCIPKTTLLYHLSFLEKNEFIIVTSEDSFKRYYCLRKVGVKTKKIFSILRQETPRKIMLFILLHRDFPSQIEISHFINKHPTTVAFHLEKLIEKDLVINMIVGNETKYRINFEHELYDFLIEYDNSILEDLMPFALEWWEYNMKKNRIDKIVENLYDIFPNPYCA